MLALLLIWWAKSCTRSFQLLPLSEVHLSVKSIFFEIQSHPSDGFLLGCLSYMLICRSSLNTTCLWCCVLHASHMTLQLTVLFLTSWAPKNWCFWTVALERTLESHLDCKEIQLVHPKGHQSWVFIGRTDVEAETPKLWKPDAKNWLTGKDPDAGKDWGWEEKGMAEDEMAGWHHRLDGHEFE